MRKNMGSHTIGGKLIERVVERVRQNLNEIDNIPSDADLQKYGWQNYLPGFAHMSDEEIIKKLATRYKITPEELYRAQQICLSAGGRLASGGINFYFGNFKNLTGNSASIIVTWGPLFKKSKQWYMMWQSSGHDQELLNDKQVAHILTQMRSMQDALDKAHAALVMLNR